MLVAVIAIAACCGKSGRGDGEGDGEGEGEGEGVSATAVFERVDRCTLRRVQATDEQRTAMEAAIRAKYGPHVVSVQLTAAGDGAFNLGFRGAPAPAVPPDTQAAAVAAAKVALERYRGAFGVARDRLPPPDLHAARWPRDGLAWKLSGALPGGESRDHVTIDLEESGAPRMIVVKAWPTEPTPDALCPDPRVALDDPRVRRATIGAKVTEWPSMQPKFEVVFTAADIGDIRYGVVQLEPGVFRRVIDVDLQGRKWTAHVDADTAKLIRIDANFVY